MRTKHRPAEAVAFLLLAATLAPGMPITTAHAGGFFEAFQETAVKLAPAVKVAGAAVPAVESAMRIQSDPPTILFESDNYTLTCQSEDQIVAQYRLIRDLVLLPLRVDSGILVSAVEGALGGLAYWEVPDERLLRAVVSHVYGAHDGYLVGSLKHATVFGSADPQEMVHWSTLQGLDPVGERAAVPVLGILGSCDPVAGSRPLTGLDGRSDPDTQAPTPTAGPCGDSPLAGKYLWEFSDCDFSLYFGPECRAVDATGEFEGCSYEGLTVTCDDLGFRLDPMARFVDQGSNWPGDVDRVNAVLDRRGGYVGIGTENFDEFSVDEIDDNAFVVAESHLPSRDHQQCTADVFLESPCVGLIRGLLPPRSRSLRHVLGVHSARDGEFEVIQTAPLGVEVHIQELRGDVRAEVERGLSARIGEPYRRSRLFSFWELRRNGRCLARVEDFSGLTKVHIWMAEARR